MSITPFFHVYHKYVFIMANISKIKISGTSYNIKDENACNVVELTQAQYDDLPTTAKTSNSLFVITDATAGDLSNYYTKSETDGLLDTKLDVTAYTPTDLSNYYTKSETSGATEISTALASKADTATTYTKTETDNAITAATSTKQDTLVSGTNIKTINNQSILGEGNITIEGGSGGESCTVDSTTMFYTFSGKYSNYGLDMMVRYAVLDYGNNKTETPDVSVEVYFRDINYIPYVNQTIQLNYSTSSYTLGDVSQAEYIDVTYDSTIEDFKIAVATAHTSTVFIDNITFSNGKIKVPFYTISSGSPCTVIENDIPTVISELGNNMLKGVKKISIGSQQDAISIYTETLGGNGLQGKLKLDEIDGSGSTLKPDIYIGLGKIGWTEINLSNQCTISSLKSTKYRVTYNNGELDANSMGLQFIVEYGVNEVTNQINFDETHHPSLQTTDLFSAATIDWNDSTRELVITYPTTIELYGIQQESVNIREIYSNNCNFGYAITKLESYGEIKQALKPYVKETRAALSGKQDTLVSGTNIKTINNQSILGEGNIEIQGGSGGGKAISAGTNISITSGETADTINCTLPISANGSSIIIKYGSNSASANNNFSQVFGSGNTIDGYGGYNQTCITVEGIGNSCGTQATHVEGGYNIGIYGSYSHVEGAHNKLTVSTSPYVEVCSHVEGKYNKVLNYSEHASGQYNNSVSASTTFGDSGNTLFSVGNGTADNARHNAFEIRQNGDIYISKDGQDVKLQDQLGGGGSITIDQSLDSGSTNPVANSAITNAINNRATKGEAYGSMTFGSSSGKEYVLFQKVSGTRDSERYISKINGFEVWGTTNANACKNWELVETSAITTSISSSSTDSQVPSAKAVYDMVGNINTILENI